MPGRTHLATIARMTVAKKKSGFSQEAGFLLIDATDESGPHHQLPR
ncbi:hypothetical protein [Herbaspirillum aquaticum]|nr:hypothetical protein [Herbaspirillum aquaticum]